MSMHRLANGRLEATIRLVGWKRNQIARFARNLAIFLDPRCKAISKGLLDWLYDPSIERRSSG